jgi:hypothetical protein
MQQRGNLLRRLAAGPGLRQLPQALAGGLADAAFRQGGGVVEQFGAVEAGGLRIGIDHLQQRDQRLAKAGGIEQRAVGGLAEPGTEVGNRIELAPAGGTQTGCGRKPAHRPRPSR